MELTTGGETVFETVIVLVAVVLLEVVTVLVGVGIFRHWQALEMAVVAYAVT